MRRVVTVASCLAIVATSGVAFADDLADARRFKASLRYEEAQRALDRAVASGTQTPRSLVEIHRLGAEVAAGLGQTDRARQHFARLLQLAPDTSLGPGTSPKILGPFREAKKANRARGSLRVRYVVQTHALVLIIENDPLSMIAGARVTAPSGTSPVTVRGSGRITVPVSAERVVLEAIDAHGNVLRRFGSRAVPIELRASEPKATRRPGALGRWYVWASVAGLLAGAGGAFGLAARNAEGDLDELNRRSAQEPFTHPFADAEAIERRGKRYALAANIGFVTAGVAGVVGAILLIRDRRARPRREVTLAPTHGGGVVGLALPW